MNNVVSFKPGQKPDDTAETSDHLATVVARLNGLHAVVSMGGKTVIMTERPSAEFPDRIDRTFSDKRDLALLYANDRHVVGLDKRDRPLIQTADVIWIQSPDRLQYDNLILDPTKAAGPDNKARVYNLWRGWPIERTADFFKPAAMGKWKLTREFLVNIICNGDKKIFRWLCAWMAERLKHPERTAGVALVLMGDEGIGKGFFTKTVMGGCYDPQHFLHVTDQDHLLGRFNAHLADALLVFADEAFFAADPSVKGRLNGLITETEILLEAKFLSPVRLRNMRAFVFASNEDLVIPAGPGARRFAVLKVNESHKEDRKYFGALEAELNDGGREEMIRWLIQEDFADANPYKAPMTDALMEQKELGFSGPVHYWFDLLCAAKLPQYSGAGDPYQPWREQSSQDVSVSAVVDDYLKLPHAKKQHERQIRAAETELGIVLKKFIPSATKTRRRWPDGTRIGIWNLPSLTTARAEFDKKLGAPYPWDLPVRTPKKQKGKP